MTRFALWNTLGYFQTLQQLRPLGRHGFGHENGFRPFFIIGSGRAGTTLLRRILCASGEVHIPPETALLPIMKLYARHAGLRWNNLVYLMLSYFEYRRGFGYSMAPLAERLRALPRNERTFATLLMHIYRFDAEANGREPVRWGDKTPDNVQCMDELLALYPDAKFVHAYRDGCDVVASLLKYFWDDPERCARRWVESIHAARAFGARHPSIYHEVRYEDLVQSPTEVTKSLCGFLDIEFDPTMTQFSDEQLDGVHDVLQRPFHQNLKKPISTANIGKGRKTLTEEHLGVVEPIIDDLLVELGYSRCRS